MLEPVLEYIEAAVGGDQMDEARFVYAMVNHVGDPRNLDLRTGEDRVVLWTAGLVETPRRFFLSPRALSVAQELGYELQIVGKVAADDLPPTESRVLILGDQAD